jgi:hypothetical protein
MVVTHCKNWFTDRVLQARDRAIARYRGAPRGSLAGGGAPLSPALSPTLSPRIAPAESPTGDARAPSPLEVCGAVSAFSRSCVPVDRLHPASPLKTAPAPVCVALFMLLGDDWGDWLWALACCRWVGVHPQTRWMCQWLAPRCGQAECPRVVWAVACLAPSWWPGCSCTTLPVSRRPLYVEQRTPSAVFPLYSVPFHKLHKSTGYP